MYTYRHAAMQICRYALMHMYWLAHACMQPFTVCITYMNIHVLHVCMYICICICILIYMLSWIFVCMSLCVCVFMYMLAYTDAYNIVCAKT